VRHLAQREKIILAALLAAVMGFCLYFFLLSPQLKVYAQMKNELSDYQKKLSQAQITVSTLNSESEKLAQAKIDLEDTGQLFETEMRDGSDIICLGLKAADKNIDITDIEPGEIKENKYSLQLPLSIIAEGDYRNMIAFCTDQESLPNLSALKSIKFETTESLPPGFVKASFSLVIYSAKTPQNKLQLEQIARWATGRHNVFLPSEAVTPVPELAGHLKTTVESLMPNIDFIPPATTNGSVYSSTKQPEYLSNLDITFSS